METLQKTIEYYRTSQKIYWVNPESFLHLLAVLSDECSKVDSVQGSAFKLFWDGEYELRYHARAMEIYAQSL